MSFEIDLNKIISQVTAPDNKEVKNSSEEKSAKQKSLSTSSNENEYVETSSITDDTDKEFQETIKKVIDKLNENKTQENSNTPIEDVTKTSTNQNATQTEAKGSLESQKEALEAEINDLNIKLASIINDTESSIKAKKDIMNAAKQDYEETVQQEAKNKQEVKTLYTQKEKNEEEIKDKNDKLTKNQELLEGTQKEKEKQEKELEALQKEKQELEEKLKTLQNKLQNGEDVQDEINSVNEKLEGVTQNINSINDKLKDLQDKQNSYSKTIEGINQELETLNDKNSELQEDIKKTTAEQIQLALKNYQDKQAEYEQAKQSAITQVQNDIANKTSALNAINSEISAQKTSSTSGVNGTSATNGVTKTLNTGSFAQYNAQRGQALAQAAESLYGNVYSSGGLCATGVSQAINKAFGYATSGNGCDYGNVLSGLSDWVEVTDSVSVDDLKNLPAGAIVSWSPYNTTSAGSIYGHVYIADGQGHEISDFKTDITSYYADRGGEYRVFLPV